MGSVLHLVLTNLKQAPAHHGFLELLFGAELEDIRQGRPVLLFGAGRLGEELLGALKNHGIPVTAFCDNGAAESRGTFHGLPVLDFPTARRRHPDAVGVVASKRHQAALSRQLREGGFLPSQIKGADTEPWSKLLYVYANEITQLCLGASGCNYRSDEVLEAVRKAEREIERVYAHLGDEKSKRLMVAKLSFLASDGNLALFRDFILGFSEPLLACGLDALEVPPEDVFYFQNDVLRLEPDEVYVDVGAFDGDTVATFVDACARQGVGYRHIHAFEPDPACHARLRDNTRGVARLSCHPQGIWDATTTLHFRSSEASAHDQAAAISAAAGDTRIEVTSLDDFFRDQPVTFIKADPGGNIIPHVLSGAATLIRTQKPKLAMGAYHALESLWEVPARTLDLLPEYRIYLRHNTCHLCDTDMYATV